MLKDEERRELLKKADDAWAEVERYSYEVIAPRSYKEKRGRKQELIHPWKDMRERLAAEEKEHQLYQDWLSAFQKYIGLTGERPYLRIFYAQQETPNGIRWVKRELSQPTPH